MLHALITLAEDEQDGFRNQIVGGGLYSMNAFVYKWRKIFLLQFVSVHIFFFLFLPDRPALYFARCNKAYTGEPCHYHLMLIFGTLHPAAIVCLSCHLFK